MAKISAWLAVASAVLLFSAGTVFARPAHKQALAQYIGPFLPKKLNDCRTCHVPDAPNAKDEEADKPHNPFGARLQAIKDDLRKAGKKTTLDARLDAILQEDNDGDGVANLVEILTGHSPGDAKDRPTAEEISQAKTVLVAFQKFRSGYPWRPFETVQRPVLPKVKNTAWVRNPIDAFIAAEHEAYSLKPRPEAPKPVLLRRLYLDLIGLPPTADELHVFLEESAAKPQAAYEKVVDRLLASPRYGERWGRHWMDIWRYSDWAGFGPQVRDSQPHIWRWRDWIIDSLNEDKGYDRMILEMLAGDELAPEDPKALAGTGFLVRNYKLLSREKWMQDTVEHTAQGFLGITLGCARCHDHMFDPIQQKEYYQVRAIFEPHQVRTDRLPGETDIKKDGLVRVYDAQPEVPTYRFVRGDDRTPDKSKSMAPGVPEVLGGRFPAIQAVSLPTAAIAPDKRKFVIQELVQASARDISKAEAALDAVQKTEAKGDSKKVELARLNVAVARARHSTLEAVLKAEELEDAGKIQSAAWKEAALAASRAQRQSAVVEGQQKVFALQLQGSSPPKGKKVDPKQALADAQKQLAKAEADLQLPLTTNYTKREVKTYPAQSTGRRLAFARWIADKENPLTARVAVNHIWLRHFGQALVPSVFDFGRNGRLPSHAALLDWLAAEFMDSTSGERGASAPRSWSMKHLHRLIVTSNTYRQASTPDAGNLTSDRDNKYLWRMTPRRVEAEVVRDCVYYVAGKLDLTMGGPDIDHALGLTVPRRSLYFRHAAEKKMEFLTIFDGPSVNECYERKQSIAPQQALALANSELAIKHARILARSLNSKHKDATAFTTAAFEQVLSRPPTAAEMAECTSFLQQQAEGFKAGQVKGPSDSDGRLPSPDATLRARENLVHVLLNHHEFVTIR